MGTNILKKTISLCPQCLNEVPATICEENGAAIMHKVCPDHGEFAAIVERNISFYNHVGNHWSSTIYPGVLIDVTYKCNLRCKWCFQDLKRSEPTIRSVMAKVNSVPKGFPIILSGGEPTCRKDLSEIIGAISKNHPVITLTNGYNIDWTLPTEWVISYHEENKHLFANAILHARIKGNKFNSIIFTVDSVGGFVDAMEMAISLEDVAINSRIHFVSPVGADDGRQIEKMFVSDMIYEAKKHYPQLVMAAIGKLQYYPIAIDGCVIIMIAWADKYNIDLKDLDCPPYYHDKTGKQRHLVEALIYDGHIQNN